MPGAVPDHVSSLLAIDLFLPSSVLTIYTSFDHIGGGFIGGKPFEFRSAKGHKQSQNVVPEIQNANVCLFANKASANVDRKTFI